MPKCKIIAEWLNADGWKMGDTVDISDPWVLIQEGRVLLLDDQGKEVAPPGTEMKCPICVYKVGDPFVYARHILTHEKREEKGLEVKTTTDTVTIQESKKRTPEELRAMRIENLRKAREARKAKEAVNG